jgi:DNA primase
MSFSTALKTLSFEQTMRAVLAATRACMLDDAVWDYLYSRGVSRVTADNWGLGLFYDSIIETARSFGGDPRMLAEAGIDQRLNGRLTIPIMDALGQPRGFIGRRVSGGHPAKYIYPDKSPYLDRRSHLLGLHHVLRRSIEYVVLVEGPFDAIVLESVGIPVVCCHGSGFTEEQALILRALGVPLYLMPDPDETGENMVRHAFRWKRSLPDTLLIKLPDKDPAMFFLGDDPLSKLKALMNSAKPVF